MMDKQNMRLAGERIYISGEYYTVSNGFVTKSDDEVIPICNLNASVERRRFCDRQGNSDDA